jgi:hypothetical protein
VISQETTDPRSGSKPPAARHAWKKTSVSTSSASARSLRMRNASEKTTPWWRS